MNPPHKKQNKSTINSQDNHHTQEDLTIRVTRQLQIYSQTLHRVKTQNLYHQHQTRFIHQLKNAVNSVKNHTIHIKSALFSSPHVKLKELMFEAQDNNGKNRDNKKEIGRKMGMEMERKLEESRSSQLKQILDRKIIDEEERQIQKLKGKLNNLYMRINQQLTQNCFSDKVMTKIKKQSSINAKLYLLSVSQKQMQHYQSWKKQKEDLLNTQNTQKEFQAKLLQNLDYMKHIMAKKLNNNDYIYQNLQCIPQSTPQNIQRITKIFNQQHLANQQSYHQQNVTNFIDRKVIKTSAGQGQQHVFDIERVGAYLRDVDDTIDMIESYEFQYEEREEVLRGRMQAILRRNI